MGELFETTDIEVAEHILRGAYTSGLRLRSRGQHGGIRLAQEQLGDSVRLERIQFNLSFEQQGTPLDFVGIGYLRSGRLTYESGGSERRQLPGDLFIAVHPGDPYAAGIEDADTETAIISLDLVSQVADTAPARRPQPVRFTGYQPVTPQAATRWRAAYDHIRDTITGNEEAADQPLLAASAARLLAAVTLAAFPNNALADPTIEDRHDAHPDTLRRAIAFIDENAHRDITAADIAATAFVTIRAVQLAFRRHLDTTPTEYLRRARLDHAHHDLLAADPARTTITAVAYRWGFPSASRFAGHYRRAYGVTPTHTLHQK